MPFLETYVHRATFTDLMTEALDADVSIQGAIEQDPRVVDWLRTRCSATGYQPVAHPSVICTMPFVTPEGDRAFFTPAGVGLYSTLADTDPANDAFMRNPRPQFSDIAQLVPLGDSNNQVLMRNLTMFGMGSGFLMSDVLTMAGGRGPVALREARRIARNHFNDPAALWTCRTGGSPAEIVLRPGCYAVVGDSIAGKSTFLRLLASRLTGPTGTCSHFVSWGEPEGESLDGMDVANMLLELSIGATIDRIVFLDSTRYLSLFAAGPSGSKGLSKGLLAWLTAMSRSAAALGLIIIVAVPPFEIAGDATAYKVFCSEVIGACTGSFEITMVGGNHQALMSIRRPLAEGGRAKVPVSFVGGAAAGPTPKNRRALAFRLVQP
jgi:hypothetical protein